MIDFQKIPFDNITKFGQVTLLDNSLFTVSWIIDRFCNYKCSYCWPYARADTPKIKNLNLYLNVIDNIKKQARNNGFTKFHFSFSGGEPTAFKYLTQILEYYSSDKNIEYKSIHMTTNLSPGKKWWSNWLKITQPLNRRGLTASYHAEFANEQEFGDKCLNLIDNGVYVTINQVMVPDMFYELYARLERFANRGINVTLKPQSDKTASEIVNGYTLEQIKIMRQGFPQKWKGESINQIRLYDEKGNEYLLDQAERFNAFNFNKFKGWQCNAGYQGIVIREDEVKRSYSCKEQPLGSLENFEIFKVPKKCITKTCVSSADSKIPKIKNV